MLNWRRDPDDERRMRQSEQIKNETAPLRRENARERALSALIRQHCFSDESSSPQATPTEPDCRSSAL